MLMMFYTNMLERSKSAPVQSNEPLYPSGGAASPHRADTSRARTRNVRNDIAALVRTDQWNDTSELHHASVPGHRHPRVSAQVDSIANQNTSPSMTDAFPMTESVVTTG